MNRSLCLFVLLLTLFPARAEVSGRDVLIAAHRGGYANDKADAAPENSVANVAVAVAKGFDLYETDIQRTRDGVFVIVHDETIARETTGQGQVSDLTLSDLKTLQKRYRDGSVSEEKVATLEELLLAGKGQIQFKADLKPGLVEHFDALAGLIHRLGLVDEIFIRCSRKEAAEIGRHLAAGTPKVELMVKVDTAAQVRDVAKHFSPKTIQINVEKNVPLSSSQREAIKAAVEAGMIVEAHSYNDPAQWEELIEAGVRMFHTTLPAEALKWLGERGWR
jgi:glycerophosphoryl diester phosphodiesterase